MDLLTELDARGLLHDCTDRRALASRLASGPIGLYIGFDPTADSLHVGHLVGQLFMRRFQLAGHRPFPLAGGATGMIGDPSGRSDERNLLDVDTLRHNVDHIAHQLRRLLDFEPGPYQATLVNNADWTESMTLLEFLRDIGKHATVNQMLAKDSVRGRLDAGAGMSFTEFSYSLLQANDYRHLYEHHGVELQAGASDQWGNIVAGVDLVRRRTGAAVHGATHPLMTLREGVKFGKSAGNAPWLDPEQTSPYQFWQFWVQTDDQMVGGYLRMLSLRPLHDVEDLVVAHDEAPERRVAQRALADEMTALVHGGEAATHAAEAAAVLFGDDPRMASAAALAFVAGEVPSSRRPLERLDDVPAVLVETGLASSKSEARRLIEQRSVRANGDVIGVDRSLAEVPLLHERYLMLRRGRRWHHLVEVFRERG
ncbi:MAG: tyrosine--tRNA ligase [Actinomycetota bacterium]|nr:tyrosine--tRNA ligase [Actinomycetota bacterium]